MKQFKYPLLILLGGCSYGILSTIIKLAYRDGFTVGEVINSQYLFGWLMLLTLVLSLSAGPVKLPFKKWLMLTLVGTNTGLTGIFYGMSLQTIPASVAIILLFQFTWIGIVLEAIDTRKLPGIAKINSTLFLLAGTVLASGIFATDVGELNPRGLFFGFLSAVTYALFIFVSGKVNIEVPALTRSLYMTTGSLVMLLCIFTPSFLYNGSLGQGLWKYGIILGLFGIAIPIWFLAIGVPHVGPGISSILSAAELPVVILSAMLVLKEQVTGLQWLGVFIILLGIGIPQIKRGSDFFVKFKKDGINN